MAEAAGAGDKASATLIRGGGAAEAVEAHGVYHVECIGADGKVKWTDTVDNIVTTEGRNAMLTHTLKGSAYTASNVIGLISDASYTTPDAADTAAQINTTGSANGWNEATTGVAAARQTPTFGTAGSGSLATSSAASFSIVGSATLKGCFLLVRSTAGTAPTTTVGNTSGALYSAGAFSGGDRAVQNGDTLNITYTASLTAA